MNDDQNLLIAFEFTVKQVLLERVVKDPLFVIGRFLDFNPVILDAPIDQRPSVERLQPSESHGNPNKEAESDAEAIATEEDGSKPSNNNKEETYFSYALGKGKSFLLRCSLNGLKVRVDTLPFLVLVYTKPPSPTAKTRVIGSCLLRLGELLTRFRRRLIKLDGGQDVVESESDASTQPIFDLNGRVSGFVGLECAFVKYADAPAVRSNNLHQHARFSNLKSPEKVVEEKRESPPKLDVADAALQTEPEVPITPRKARPDVVKDTPKREPRPARSLQPQPVHFGNLDDEQAEQLVQPAPLCLAQPYRATSAPVTSPELRLPVHFHTPRPSEGYNEDVVREDDWTLIPPGEREQQNETLGNQGDADPEPKRSSRSQKPKPKPKKLQIADDPANEIERKLQQVRGDYPMLAALLRELLGPLSAARSTRAPQSSSKPTRSRSPSPGKARANRSRSHSHSRSPSASRSPSWQQYRERGAYMDDTVARGHASCPRLHRVKVESAARPDLSVLSRKPRVPNRGAGGMHEQSRPKSRGGNWSVRPTRAFMLRRESSAASSGRTAAKHFERPEVWQQTYAVS